MYFYGPSESTSAYIIVSRDIAYIMCVTSLHVTFIRKYENVNDRLSIWYHR